jgi:hypothetical protein
VSTARPQVAYRGSDRRAMSVDRSGDYRGPNRRGGWSARTQLARFRYALLACPLLLLAAIAADDTLLGGRSRVVTFAALRDGSAGLLVLAGTVLVVGWALTGRAARALDGSALLLVGGGLLMLAGPWAVLLRGDETTVLTSPGARLALGLPALVLLTRSCRVGPVNSAIHPLSTLATVAGCALGVLGVEALLRLHGPIDHSAVWITALAGLAAAWIGAGLQRVTAPVGSGWTAGGRAMGWALIAWGVGDIMLAIAQRDGLAWGVGGAALQLIGAAVVSWNAVRWLLRVVGHDGSRNLHLLGELADVTTVLADEQSFRRQLQHDAINVVAAIRVASVTLERHGERLDPAVQHQLRTTVGAEFDRLQSLLNPPLDPAPDVVLLPEPANARTSS